MEEQSIGRAASAASVALDLRPGTGALVIYPNERFRGCEIKISRDGDRRVHTGVHERSTVRGPVLTAIFGRLPAGEYVVWSDAATPAATVAVAEGTVAEVSLS